MVLMLNALPQHKQTLVFGNDCWPNIERAVHFALLAATIAAHTA